MAGHPSIHVQNDIKLTNTVNYDRKIPEKQVKFQDVTINFNNNEKRIRRQKTRWKVSNDPIIKTCAVDLQTVMEEDDNFTHLLLGVKETQL